VFTLMSAEYPVLAIPSQQFYTRSRNDGSFIFYADFYHSLYGRT